METAAERVARMTVQWYESILGVRDDPPTKVKQIPVIYHPTRTDVQVVDYKGRKHLVALPEHDSGLLDLTDVPF